MIQNKVPYNSVKKIILKKKANIFAKLIEYPKYFGVIEQIYQQFIKFGERTSKKVCFKYTLN